VELNILMLHREVQLELLRDVLHHKQLAIIDAHTGRAERQIEVVVTVVFFAADGVAGQMAHNQLPTKATGTSAGTYFDATTSILGSLNPSALIRTESNSRRSVNVLTSHRSNTGFLPQM